MSKSEVTITIDAHDVAGFAAAMAAVRLLGPVTVQAYQIERGARLRGPLGDLELCRATATFLVSFDTADVDVREAYASLDAMCNDATGSASATHPLRIIASR